MENGYWWMLRTESQDADVAHLWQSEQAVSVDPFAGPTRNRFKIIAGTESVCRKTGGRIAGKWGEASGRDGVMHGGGERVKLGESRVCKICGWWCRIHEEW